MIDIARLAPGLRAAEPGLWVSDRTAGVSFPSDGHAGCFALEDDSFWFSHRNLVILEALGRFPPPGVLIDVGGGNGCVTRAVQQAGYEAVLLEPGAEGVRNARARGVTPVICATLEHAGFGDNLLPAVGIFDVLEHVADDAGFLCGVRRMLHPDGRLYVTVPALGSLWSDADTGAGHYRRYGRRALDQLLAVTGFEIEYSTAFFTHLVLPILLLRTLPSRLRRHPRQRTLQQRALSEHVASSGLTRAWQQRYARFECAVIRAGRSLPVGSSLLCVARPASN